MPGLTPITTLNGSSIFSRTLTQLYKKSTFSYNGTPHIYPQDCPLPWGNRQPQQPASTLDLADPPPQMASRSNQPFCHITPDGQTNRWDRQQNLYQHPLMLYRLYSDTALLSGQFLMHRNTAEALTRVPTGFIWWTLRGVSGWVFLLVLAHPCCPGQSPESRNTVVCCASKICGIWSSSSECGTGAAGTKSAIYDCLVFCFDFVW